MAYGKNAPFGLQPRRKLTNDELVQNSYLIASGYATSLYTGDPVVVLADGTIGIGVAGTGILGVFNGCQYTNALNQVVFSPFWTAATVTQGAVAATAFVYDDPNIVYDIQVSNTANVVPTFAATDINQNANFAVAAGGANLIPQNPAAGSTVTGQSAYYLDFNSLNTTATLSLKILGFTPVPGNGPSTVDLPYCNVEVLINNHVFKGGTGSAGV